jgi:hypothetical protein
MFSSSESWDFNSTHVYGTHVPVEEPSTASKGDIRVDPEIREVRKLVTSSLFSISPRYLAITFRILVFLTVPMHHTDAGLWGIRGCDLRR